MMHLESYKATNHRKDLNLSVLQRTKIKHDIGKLFYDEDNEKLTYKIEGYMSG